MQNYNSEQKGGQRVRRESVDQSAIAYAKEKYQKARGMVYMIGYASFTLERQQELGSQQPTKLLPHPAYEVL